jgi:hypothetical protein
MKVKNIDGGSRMKYSLINRSTWMNSVQNWIRVGVLCIALLACIGSPSLADTNLNGQGTAILPATLQGMMGSGFSACALADGGYLFSSSIASEYVGSKDVLLIKTDAAGKILWQKKYGGTGDEEANKIRQTADGGFILAGSTTSFNENMDIYLLKLDASGTVQWARNFGGRTDNSVITNTTTTNTFDNGYRVSTLNSSKGLAKDYYDTFVLDKNEDSADKTTADISTLAEDAGFDVVASSDGGYVLTGYTQPSGGSADIILLKVDHRGVLQWARSLGGGSDDRASCLQECKDKGFIIAGYTSSVGIGSRARATGDNADRTDKDAYLIKTDSNGYVVWQKTYGGSNDDEANCVIENNQGFVIAGYTIQNSKNPTPCLMLMQTNKTGNSIWQNKNYSFYSYYIPRGILNLTSGEIVISGNAIKSGAVEAMLLKYNQNGTLLWERYWKGNGNTLIYGLLAGKDNKSILYGTLTAVDSQKTEQQMDPLVLEYDTSGQLLAEKTIVGSGLTTDVVSVETVNNGDVPESPKPKGSRGSGSSSM